VQCPSGDTVGLGLLGVFAWQRQPSSVNHLHLLCLSSPRLLKCINSRFITGASINHPHTYYWFVDNLTKEVWAWQEEAKECIIILADMNKEITLLMIQQFCWNL